MFSDVSIHPKYEEQHEPKKRGKLTLNEEEVVFTPTFL